MTSSRHAETIQTQLQAQFKPLYLSIIDESHLHHTHTNAATHFNVVLVSALFQDLSRLQRHQAVNRCLRDVFAQIHALALHLFTPNEWDERKHQPVPSPQCRGGFDAH